MEAAMKVAEVVGWFAVTIVGSSLGAYLGAYAGQKGKNLATHEDIDKLVDQVRAVTREQEVIKATISGDLWTRQAAATLKRDAYVAIISALADYESAAPTQEGVFDYDSLRDQYRPKPGKEEEAKAYKERLICVWMALHRNMMLGEFVFDSRAVAALRNNALPADAISIKDIPAVFGKLRAALREEAQRELFGVE